VVELAPMLDEYYRLMGWDANGVPSRERLKLLGLDAVVLPEKEVRAQPG
jgi:aldehyde:ferredoxin oxidoreductase